MKATVFTVNSVYLLDTDAMTLTRTPFASGDLLALATLRRDGEPIPVKEILMLQVGEPFRIMLALRKDGTLTYRETSPVQQIIYG